MSDTDDQRGREQRPLHEQRPVPEQPPVPEQSRDRGYYGAGWSVPSNPALQQQPPHQQQHGQQPYGQQQRLPQQPYGQPQPYGHQQLPQQPWGRPDADPGAGPGARSAGARRASRRPSDPSRAFAPGVSAAQVRSAGIAVLGVVAVQAVSSIAYLVGLLVVHGTALGRLGSSLLLVSADRAFMSPFPFYAASFLALVFLTPVVRRSPLPVVLVRAVLAGAAGMVGLALVGIGTGAYHAASTGVGGYVLSEVVTDPITAGVPLTAVLVATATVAWLWLGRPGRSGGAGRAAVRPGLPGTVRPADAVPPATIEQQQQQQQQPYRQDPPRR